MNTPRTIPEYLSALRAALHGADPALIQDALYDAEEYLRSELAARPGSDEATLLAEMVGSYGAPEEVAAIYTEREQQVVLALNPPSRRLPAAAPATPWYRRLFGVVLEARTYGAVLYMLLALPLGIFYFTWAVAGVSISAGVAVLIIGVPFMILFMTTVYLLSLLEGRLVEVLLGERMPRRPATPPAAATLWQRIGNLLGDPRTWSTLLYMVLKLPLGVLYFSLTVTLLSLSTGLTIGGIIELFSDGHLRLDGMFIHAMPTWAAPLVSLAGIALFFASLHLLRLIGRGHAALAKAMLVMRPRNA